MDFEVDKDLKINKPVVAVQTVVLQLTTHQKNSSKNKGPYRDLRVKCAVAQVVKVVGLLVCLVITHKPLNVST